MMGDAICVVSRTRNLLTTGAKLATLDEHTHLNPGTSEMPNLSDTRRANIRALVDERGGLTKLSKILGYKNPSFLSQMLSVGGATREVTERTARRIEDALGLPSGHLDHQAAVGPLPVSTAQAEPVPVARPTARATSEETVKLVADVIRAVGAACDEAGVNMAPGKFADLVALVYTDSVERGMRPDHVAQLVRLLR